MRIIKLNGPCCIDAIMDWCDANPDVKLKKDIFEFNSRIALFVSDEDPKNATQECVETSNNKFHRLYSGWEIISYGKNCSSSYFTTSWQCRKGNRTISILLGHWIPFHLNGTFQRKYDTI